MWLREHIAYRIHVWYGYAADTYQRSIRFFLNFTNFEYVYGYVSVYWIRSSSTNNVPLSPSVLDALAPNGRTSCSRATSSERAHGRLVLARRSQATGLRPRLPAANDEPPLPLTGDSLHSHAQPPAQGMCHHLLAAIMPSPSLRPLRAINQLLLQTPAPRSTHQSTTAATRSSDQRDAGKRMIQQQSNLSTVYSTSACTSSSPFLIYSTFAVIIAWFCLFPTSPSWLVLPMLYCFIAHMQ